MKRNKPIEQHLRVGGWDAGSIYSLASILRKRVIYLSGATPCTNQSAQNVCHHWTRLSVQLAAFPSTSHEHRESLRVVSSNLVGVGADEWHLIPDAIAGGKQKMTKRKLLFCAVISNFFFFFSSSSFLINKNKTKPNCSSPKSVRKKLEVVLEDWKIHFGSEIQACSFVGRRVVQETKKNLLK